MPTAAVGTSLIVSVHLRVRRQDGTVPKSMYPSTSAITYWQIEKEHNLIDGNFCARRGRALISGQFVFVSVFVSVCVAHISVNI